MTDSDRWRPLTTAVLLLAVAAAMARLVQMWLASGYGMDFTDEGYYLVWIDNPAAYKESATQFGFFYHPIYEYFGKNIGRLRQANILVTFGLSWCLGFALFRVLFPPLPNDVQQPLAIGGTPRLHALLRRVIQTSSTCGSRRPATTVLPCRRRCW